MKGIPESVMMYNLREFPIVDVFLSNIYYLFWETSLKTQFSPKLSGLEGLFTK
jgi:hypothetical protein